MNVHSLQDFPIHSKQILISERCVKEIKSSLSKTFWSLVKNRVSIISPTNNGLSKARSAAQSLGEYKLSEADISALALAMDHISDDPVLISDDYSVQNVAKSLNIKTKTSKQKKKVKIREYYYICKACGHNNGKNGDECDVCGSEIFNRKF